MNGKLYSCHELILPWIPKSRHKDLFQGQVQLARVERSRNVPPGGAAAPNANVDLQNRIGSSFTKIQEFSRTQSKHTSKL